MNNLINSDFLFHIKDNNGIFVFDSGVEGEITTILTGVHGNEISGIIALEKLLKNIEVIRGKVNLIVGNIKAVESNVRFIDENMNRIFYKFYKSNSYESNRVQEILKFLSESDNMLDVHNTLDKGAKLFLLSEHVDGSNLFNVDFVIDGFDNLHPGSSDSFINSMGKRGYCLETGYYGSQSSHRFAYKSIINFLRNSGNIDGSVESYNIPNFISFDYKYITKTGKFRLTKSYKDFDKVEKNEVIGYDDNNPIISPYSGYILFAYNPLNSKRVAFCLGKDKN